MNDKPKDVQQYRKKPVVIEAVRVPSSQDQTDDILDYVDRCVEIASWCGGSSYMMHSEGTYYDGDPGYDHILIPTLEGDMRARPGDWIIKGTGGEFYPCKPDIFASIYDPVTP